MFPVVIDCFSKFVFTEPLKFKTTDSVIAAFKKIFIRTDRRPERVQTGGEFNSTKFKKFLKENKIIYNTTSYPEIKCAMAERVIRTIKAKLFKYLTYTNSFTYIDVLDDVVKSYNGSYHRTIKMAPNEVNDRNILEVYNNIRHSQRVSPKIRRGNVKVGDYVRITKSKNVFAKGYMPNWTEELFKVTSIVERDPTVYRIADLDGDDIEGTFYKQEIQKVLSDEGGVKVIEKIIKQKRKGKTIQYFVKWRGYHSKFNSWVDSKTVSSI